MANLFSKLWDTLVLSLNILFNSLINIVKKTFNATTIVN